MRRANVVTCKQKILKGRALAGGLKGSGVGSHTTHDPQGFRFCSSGMTRGNNTSAEWPPFWGLFSCIRRMGLNVRAQFKCSPQIGEKVMRTVWRAQVPGQASSRPLSFWQALYSSHPELHNAGPPFPPSLSHSPVRSEVLPVRKEVLPVRKGVLPVRKEVLPVRKEVLSCAQGRAARGQRCAARGQGSAAPDTTLQMHVRQI